MHPAFPKRIETVEVDAAVKARREAARIFGRKVKFKNTEERAIFFSLAAMIDANAYTPFSQRHMVRSALKCERSVYRYLRRAEAGNIIFVLRQKRLASGKFSELAAVLLIDEAAKQFARSLGWVENNIVEMPAVRKFVRRLTVGQIVKEAAGQSVRRCGPKKSSKAITCETQEPPTHAENHNIDTYIKPTENISHIDNDADADFQAIETVWPNEALHKARLAFRKLKSPELQILACRWAPAFAEQQSRLGLPLGSAVAYVDQRKWEPLAKGRSAKPIVNGGLILVREGTPAFSTWAADDRAKTGRKSMFCCNQLDPDTGKLVPGILRPSLFPPGYPTPSSEPADAAPSDAVPDQPVQADEAASGTLEKPKPQSASDSQLIVLPKAKPERNPHMPPPKTCEIIDFVDKSVLSKIECVARAQHALQFGRRTLIPPDQVTDAMRRDIEAARQMDERFPPFPAYAVGALDASALALGEPAEDAAVIYTRAQS